MSRSSQNKVYYEIGVMSQFTHKLLCEYVTSVNITKKGMLVHEKLMNLMYNNHGRDIIVLYNKRNGAIPNDNRPIIKINIPKAPKLSYNR